MLVCPSAWTWGRSPWGTLQTIHEKNPVQLNGNVRLALQHFPWDVSLNFLRVPRLQLLESGVVSRSQSSPRQTLTGYCHSSLRTVFMDGMAPSAQEATGPSRREQPKDRAAAQPSSPHLRSQHAPAPQATKALLVLQLLPDFSKTRWSQQTNGFDLDAQDHQPSTAMFAS